MDFLSGSIQVSMPEYIVFCLLVIAGMLWFGVIKKRIGRKTKRKAGGAWTEGDCLEQLKELSHDYATLGTLVESFHADILSIQKELFQLDERLSKLEIRSTTIRIGPSNQLWNPEFAECVDDEDDDDQDSDVALLPQPLTGWLDLAKGLDEL